MNKESTMFDLSTIPPLSSGAHSNPDDGMCVMEAVAYANGEPFSDAPKCACPVIGAFLRSWNDGLPDDERDALLRPFILKLGGTRRDSATEMRRSVMAADWLIRTYTPAWLRLAKLNKQADLLASLPEITDFAQCPSLMPALEAVRTDATAAWDAAWGAARDAAWGAATDAAWAAATDAAWDAARDAAWGAAWDAAWGAARGAATDAAWGAARDAAWGAATDAARAAATDAARGAARGAATDAARGALLQTKRDLQQSALNLVKRMITVGDKP